MRKNNIIYSLTTRGLYSELFNLSLALVYAQHNHLSLKLNTWLWNARISKGWMDYFEPTIDCCNNPLSSQDKVYTKEKPWIGKIYYKPSEFFNYYLKYTLNTIYCFLHPHDYLTKDVFENMRSCTFIKNMQKDNLFEQMAIKFQYFYRLNSNTKKFIEQRKQYLNIPDDYIGIHIRRGDKIISKEMQDIHLDQYIDKIIEYKEISKNIYIATDDINVIEYIKQQLKDSNISIFYNKSNNNRGFKEEDFNHAPKDIKYQETINVLFDMELLIHSKFFIGTYTSNLSRVVPFFLGLDRCISLDNEWNIINSLNGL